MNKKIGITILHTLILLNTDAQQMVVSHSNKQVSNNIRQSDMQSKADSLDNKRSTLIQAFKQARKNNKRNLKNASKFYNPVTIIFHVFGI